MRYTKTIGFEDIIISLLMIRKNIWKCMISALAFFVIGILLTFNSGVENYYSASTVLYCPMSDYSESTGAIQLLSSYTSLIKSQKVAERAVSILGNTSLNYRNIQKMTSYTLSPAGMSLTISATSTESDEAIAVSNAVSNAFMEEMRTITKSDYIQVLSAAEKAGATSNGLFTLWKKRVMFFVIGFILMAGLIFLTELFSDKIRSVEQCVITDDDVVLGIIPEIREINER